MANGLVVVVEGLGFLLLCYLVPHICCATAQQLEDLHLLSAASRSIRLDPTYEEIPAATPGTTATYALWQAPPGPRAPHSILFIAHGGNRGPEVWWDATPECPFCAALPEERVIIQSALAAGHAVITIKSSRFQGGRFWKDTIDLVVVKRFLEAWRPKLGPGDLPMAGLGISGGGRFLSSLALQMEFYAMVLQISDGLAGSFQKATPAYPPVLYINMPRDVDTGQAIQDRIALLSSKGIAADNIKCPPVPVYESYFADAIPGLGVEVSAALYKALEEQGYLDGAGYLNQPAHLTWDDFDDWDWSLFLGNLHVLRDGSRWTAPVAEELAVSYGFHEVTSARVVEMLDWLDGKVKSYAGSR